MSDAAAQAPPDATGPAASGSRGHRVETAAIAVLAALTVVYTVLGLVHLHRPGGGVDLRMRWEQQRYVAQGVDPYRAYPQYAQHGGTDPFVDPTIGEAEGNPYPPWAYAINMLLVPPFGLETARIWFSIHALACLLLQAWWVYRLGARFGRRAGWLLALGSVAFYANFMTLGLGQLCIAVNLGILGLIHFLSQGRPAWAGVGLFLAMVKLPLALLFVLVPLVRREWTCLASAAALGGATTLGVAWAVGESPVELVLAVQRAAGDVFVYPDVRGSLIPGLFHVVWLLGWEVDTTRASMLFFGALAAALCWRFRDAPVLVLATLPCVLSQLWAYSRRYDHTNLFPLVVVLGLVALSRDDRRGWIAFGAVGASLWLPTRGYPWSLWVMAAQFAIWIAALVWLWRRQGAGRGLTADLCRI